MSPSKDSRYNKADVEKRASHIIVGAHDNPVCTVVLDAEVPCLIVLWKRYATSGQLRHVLERLIELLQEHHVSKILADDTALPLIHPEDQAWIVQNWMPRAVAAGLRVAANKNPSTYLGRLAVENVITRQRLFTIRSFEDLGDARQWLKDARVSS
jgi:hypothetical protein